MAGSTRNSAPKGDGGDPPDDGKVEPRLARIETVLEYVQGDVSELKGDFREMRKESRSDFRLLFGAIITVALGITALMAKGFHWL
jgi:tetrahydromethanopterin S-methyltransferase subunit G